MPQRPPKPVPSATPAIAAAVHAPAVQARATLARFAPLHLSLLLLASVAMLAACGGGSNEVAPPVAAPAPAPAPAPVSGLTGTVAVGAAITDGRVRVLDATGAVVAEDVAVAADGSYSIPALSGTAPWRVEACGYAGPTYQCLYSVVQGPGVGNVTPLTSATVLLAAGQSPGELMSGAAPGLSAEAVGAAQDQLRTALAPVLAGTVPAGFDFIGGELAAGTRTGYDRVLDALGVSTGVDGQPFVQITPRLGSGNLYLEPGGATQGQVANASGAGNLDLSGLDALFRTMSDAMASAEACAHPTSGMAASMAASARLSFGPAPVLGAPAVGGALCEMFGMEGLWGARLLSPVLGRCDLDGAQPSCRVSFVMQRPGVQGVEPIGQGMAVAREGGTWKFKGDADVLPVHASARAQRDVRVDGDAMQYHYTRALAVEVPAVDGLGCAKVSQRNSAGERVTVAYLKPMLGAPGLERLSLWMVDGNQNRASLDPAAGALRSSDDTWLMLPEGAEGDAVVRNFFRGGRLLELDLYADSACSSAFTVAGVSTLEVEIQGVPPVWASMPSLPWPELTPGSIAALRDFEVAAGDSTFSARWTFPRGVTGFNEAMFCVDRPQCGGGQPGRLGEQRIASGSTSVQLPLANPGGALPASGYKMLSLYGSSPDGLGLQSNHISCAAAPAGPHCQ